MIIKAQAMKDWDPKIQIGSFERVFKPINLGMLKGNRFSVALRYIDANLSDEEISLNVKNAIESGFINYFGMQRFGSFSIRTHQVGKEILNQNWKEVCRMILAGYADYIPGMKEKKERICDLVFSPEAEGDPH